MNFSLKFFLRISETQQMTLLLDVKLGSHIFRGFSKTSREAKYFRKPPCS